MGEVLLAKPDGSRHLSNAHRRDPLAGHERPRRVEDLPLDELAAGGRSRWRITESYDVERHIPRLMNWLTERWVGSADRDADLHDGTTTTLQRIKAGAELG